MSSVENAGRIESVCPSWDPTLLFPSPYSTEIDKVLTTVDEQARSLARRVRGRLAELDTEAVLEAVGEYDACVAHLQQIAVYAELLYALHDQGPQVAALLRRLDGAWAGLAAELDFFEPELAARDQQEDLGPFTHFARRSRAAARAGLDGPHETALAALLPTGTEGWQRLAQQLLTRIGVETDGQSHGIGQVMPALYDPDRETRATMHAAVSRALEPELELRATALDMIVADGEARARLRGTNWLEARYSDDQIRPEEADTVLAVADECMPVIHEYYELKRTVLALDPLTDYDRYAPLGTSEESVSWSEAVDLVLTSFRRIHPDFEKVARSIVENGSVDAAPRPGKKNNAFTRAIPGQSPCISMNFTGRIRDVLTLGHEMGHAVHMRLTAGLPFLAANPPSAVAETVALLCEAVTARTLLAGSTDPRRSAALLARWLEDQMVAVGRHTALHGFEVALRTELRAEGALRAERINDLWADGQRALYGPAVELTDGYRMWWSYLGPLFTDPGSHYGYVYGQLAALALLGRFEEDPADFATRFHRLLSAGDTGPPGELLAAAGVRTTEPDDWRPAAHTLRDRLAQLRSLVGTSPGAPPHTAGEGRRITTEETERRGPR